MRQRLLSTGFLAAGLVLLIQSFPDERRAVPADATLLPPALPQGTLGAETVRVSPPLRLRIPSLRIDAPVESVGLTEAGAMGIPENAFSVGWYTYGARPGEIGAAVLAGHRDTAAGTPGVFWTLRDAEPGDAILVELDSGDVLRYRVERLEQYPYDDAPMEEIFGATRDRALRLITCAGSWNKTTYAQRLVVYAVQDDRETAALD